MEFKKDKLIFDFEKMMDIVSVKKMARERNAAVVFLYPFGHSEAEILNFVWFKVKNNAYPGLMDYGVCRYKCGRSYYHATYFIIGQSKRGEMMRKKIKEGKIKVGRRPKTENAEKD